MSAIRGRDLKFSEVDRCQENEAKVCKSRTGDEHAMRSCLAASPPLIDQLGSCPRMQLVVCSGQH